MGQSLPEAVKFVNQNQNVLSQIPDAFFAVHLMNLGSDEASRKARLAYLDPVRKLITPQKEAFFAGVGDWKKVSFLDGLIGKAVKAPEGDFRDWQAIHAWAQDLNQSGFAGA
jgi:menaquinone-dependent protoporphyrinogen oxidase